MSFLKRIFLFGIVNILVIVTITIVSFILSAFLGVRLDGQTYGSLMVVALLWGMGGAFISLLLSKPMAKWMMGVQTIDPGTTDPVLRDLVQTVHGLARRAGLTGMPDVGIYESPEVNAFATGASKNRSLVAVSTGLLHRMDQSQIEGVLGHEITHITNGDMVTMTLIQGIVNAFVIFFARILAMLITNVLRGNNERESGFMSGGLYFVITIVLEMLLGFLGMIVVAFFSRIREYRADAGSARLGGREKMISALQALKNAYEIRESDQGATVATLKISGKQAGFLALFATHPSLDNRIARLSRGIQ